VNGALEKAFIAPKEGGPALTCAFNPKEYTISKSSTWHRTPARGAHSAPHPEFVGANPRSMQMELFFDAWESGGDVSTDVDTLLEWTGPTERSIADQKPNPPIVVFHWGTKSYFDAYLKQVSAKYTLFRPDGTPVRASVTVSFEEVPSEEPGTNPTSGGPPGTRSHVVASSDTLHSIAYAEYGDATLWRGLAAANGIDDPLRLPTGRTLLIPRARDAAELS
jgi:Contractile injection system tube protein/LysM domain